MPHDYTIVAEHRTRPHVFLVEDDEAQLCTWDLESEEFRPVPGVDQAEWRFDCTPSWDVPPLPQDHAQ